MAKSKDVLIKEYQEFYSRTCDRLNELADSGECKVVSFARHKYLGNISESPLAECIIGCWDVNKDIPWGLDWHCNTGIEFTFIERGEVSISVDDHDFIQKSGELVITRPWQMHRVGNPNITPSRFYWLIINLDISEFDAQWIWPSWLIFSEAEKRKLTRLLENANSAVLGRNPEIAQIFKNISQTLENYPDNSENRVKLLINHLLIVIIESFTDEDAKSECNSSEVIMEFLAELPETLASEWTLESMAEACSLAKSQFSYYCKELTNLSPVEYLNRVRIKEACKLLRNSDKSIAEISESCGFHTAKYFSSFFKKIMAMTPSFYRSYK